MTITRLFVFMLLTVPFQVHALPTATSFECYQDDLSYTDSNGFKLFGHYMRMGCVNKRTGEMVFMRVREVGAYVNIFTANGRGSLVCNLPPKEVYGHYASFTMNPLTAGRASVYKKLNSVAGGCNFLGYGADMGLNLGGVGNMEILAASEVPVAEKNRLIATLESERLRKLSNESADERRRRLRTQRDLDRESGKAAEFYVPGARAPSARSH